MEIQWRLSMDNSAKIIPVSFKPQELPAQLKKPQFIKVGEEKPQAPDGEYIARCVHVELNWTFLLNRKIALYFEISEGEHEGKTARRFYNLKKLHDGSYQIAPKSKLLRDVKQLFPEEAQKEELALIVLFSDKFFNIEVIKKIAKEGGTNSIVENLSLHNVGF